MTSPAPTALNLEPSHLKWLVETLALYVTGEPLTARDISKILPSLSLLSYPKGAEILREGDSSKEFFFLFSGIAGVHRGEETIAQLWPGELFGEVAFLSGAPRTATVRASEDCEVFRCGAEDFTRILNKFPEIKNSMSSIAQLRVARLPK